MINQKMFLYKKVGFLFAPHKNKRKEKQISEKFTSKIMSLVFVTDYKNSSMIYIFQEFTTITLKLYFRRTDVLGCPELACWQISMLEAETGAWYPHHWSGVERDFGVGHWQHPTLIVVSIWIRLGSLFVCFFACFIGRQTLQEDFVIQTK